MAISRDDSVGHVPGDATIQPIREPVRDRVRWGPILAGLLTAIVTLVILTILGLAIGLSAFEPNDAGTTTVSTSAAIWGAISALIAFFVGGWVAGRSAADTGAADNGVLNGFVVGVASIILMLWLIGTGLGNLFGVVGRNLNDVADLARNVTGSDATTVARSAYDDARNSAWGTLAGLLLALGASTLGGYIGQIRKTVGMVAEPLTTRTRSRV